MIIKANIKNTEVEIEIPDNEYWIERNKKRMSPYWAMADNLERRMNKEFERVYKELEKELYTFVGKYGTDNKLTYSNNRVIALMKEIKPYIDSLYDEQQLSLTDTLEYVYKDNYLKGLYDLSIGTKVAWSFASPDERAIKTAISYPWSGASFSDRIYDNKNKLLFTLKQEITQSLIRGDATKKTASAMADKLNISKSNAGRLIQTETAAALSASDKIMYGEFGFDRYEYVATLDNRTSEVCKGLDGKVFLVTDMVIGVNASPMHPRCRSTSIPYFDDNFGQRISKRLDNNKIEYIPSDISYRQWEKNFIK